MWKFATASEIGGRSEQQDRVAVFACEDTDEVLAVLADGMGGHSGGAVAAQICMETARAAWESHFDLPSEPDSLLREICLNAHREINAVGEARNLNPHSTLVLLHLDGRRACWAHVGDSRLYRFREGNLAERTDDHSLVQLLVKTGKINEAEARDHSDANLVTESLGGSREPKIDFGTAELTTDDGFLICTDGLWAEVESEEMGQVFASQEDLQKAASHLAGLATQRAGPKSDNVTVALVRMDLLAIQEDKLNDRAVHSLEELIMVCHDSCDALGFAEVHTNDESIRKLFGGIRKARAAVQENLAKVLSSLGSEPLDIGTKMGAAFMLFGKFRVAIFKNDQIVILDTLEAAENRVRGKFLKSLRRRLPQYVETEIQNQLDNVITSSDLINAMKAASKSDA